MLEQHLGPEPQSGLASDVELFRLSADRDGHSLAEIPTIGLGDGNALSAAHHPCAGNPCAPGRDGDPRGARVGLPPEAQGSELLFVVAGADFGGGLDAAVVGRLGRGRAACLEKAARNGGLFATKQDAEAALGLVTVVEHVGGATAHPIAQAAADISHLNAARDSSAAGAGLGQVPVVAIVVFTVRTAVRPIDARKNRGVQVRAASDALAEWKPRHDVNHRRGLVRLALLCLLALLGPSTPLGGLSRFAVRRALRSRALSIRCSL